MTNIQENQVWSTLSPSAKSIVIDSPRLNDYLLFAQVLSDAIVAVKEGDAESQTIVTKVEGLADLTAQLALLKQSVLQLVKYRKDFEALLIGEFKTALGLPGQPGDKAAIVAVARDLAQIYCSLRAFGAVAGARRREYSPEIPDELQHKMEPILAGLCFYVETEAQRLLRFFEKYGPGALPKLWHASQALEAGLEPGKMDMFTHTHRIGDYDTKAMDDLAALFEQIVAANAAEDASVQEHASDTPVVIPGPFSGFVYLLANPSMPGLVKVGRTQRGAHHRVKELSSATGVPLPFQVIFELAVSDCEAVERITHRLLNQYRLNTTREFFEVSSSQAIHTMLEAARIAVQRPS